jgi:hypothetical protein
MVLKPRSGLTFKAVVCRTGQPTAGSIRFRNQFIVSTNSNDSADWMGNLVDGFGRLTKKKQHGRINHMMSMSN